MITSGVEESPLSLSMMGFSPPASPVCPVNSGGGGAEFSGVTNTADWRGDEHRGLLSLPLRRGGDFGLRHFFLGGGLRLLQASGLFFVALLLRIPLCRLLEVSSRVNPLTP